MLDEYTSAFADYLRTDTVGALADFCPEGTDLSRLRVYRNGFLRTCVEALRANYPTVERLMGEECFPALARPYVEAHPPRTASLVLYGEGFPRFIDGGKEMHGLDWLASFAALDRAWSEVYFSEDDHFESNDAETGRPAAGDTLGDTDTDTDRRAANGVPGTPSATRPAAGNTHDDAEALLHLRGRLSPWVRQVSLDYRVLDVWSRLRQGALGQRAEVVRTPQRVLIWRSGAEMLYRDLGHPEHTFIAGIAAGQTCEEAAVAALAVDAGFDLATAFATLLRHHMLTIAH